MAVLGWLIRIVYFGGILLILYLLVGVAQLLYTAATAPPRPAVVQTTPTPRPTAAALSCDPDYGCVPVEEHEPYRERVPHGVFD